MENTGAAVASLTIASTISGNEAVLAGGGFYGAVKITAGSITEGADISGNIAGTDGGGLYITAGTGLTMSGGSVSGNLVTGSSSNHYGGGICLASSSSAKSSFTMTGGTVSGNTTKDVTETTTYAQYGGGIYVGPYSTVTLSGGEISDNTGFIYGGGIYINNYSEVTLKDNIIISNNSVSASFVTSAGGGMYVPQYSTVVTMTGGTISGNTAESGGGFYVNSSAVMTVSGGEITNNTAETGGGIYKSNTLIVTGNTVISGNTAQSGNGGGIRSGAVTLSGDVIISKNTSGTYGGGALCSSLNISGNVLISQNNAGDSGGGVYTYTIEMTGGEIRENSAGYAAGIFIYIHSASTAAGQHVISGGKITGNVAKTDGGGVYILSNYATGSSGTVEISGNTEISDNTAGNWGGGIYVKNVDLIVTGGLIYENNANYGGGIFSYSIARVSMTVSGGLIFDNIAKYNRGGNDVYEYGGTGVTDQSNYGMFTLAQASTLTSSKVLSEDTLGIVGTCWYLETSDEELSTEVSHKIYAYEDSSGTKHYSPAQAYTFYYTTPADSARIDETYYASVQAAVGAIENGEADSGSTIVMLKDSTENVVIPEGLTATLDLAGFTLRAASGSVIYVEEDADLTITDSSATEESEGTGAITGGKGTTTDSSTYYGGGLYVLGHVTLEGGSITGNRAAYGAGVYVRHPGTFTMTGGSVENNTLGFGVYVNYGSVASNEGIDDYVFQMSGGSISENTGGVYVEGYADTTITNYGERTTKLLQMSDGSIMDNTGRGIYIRSGQVEISGGRIEGNVDTNNNGGGINVKGDYSSLTISGGVITQNTAVEGGGICIECDYVQFTVTGGQIYENTVSSFNSKAKDIYVSRLYLGGVLSLCQAGEMKLDQYDSWYEANTVEYWTTAFKKSGTTSQTYCLTASKKPSIDGGVARIGEDTYSSIRNAVSAAIEIKKKDINADATIYLLQDWSESVTIGSDTYNKDENGTLVDLGITIDLNGWTLSNNGNYIFYINGGSLILRNTVEQQDSNLTGDGGKLMPSEGNTVAKAVYMPNRASTAATMGNLVMEGVTVTGFGNPEKTASTSSATYGGAVYAAAGNNIEISNTTFSYNYATYGGAIYITGNNNNNEVTFSMTDSLMEHNEAYRGGAIAFTGNTSGNALDSGSTSKSYLCTFALNGCNLQNNSAMNAAGALYINGHDASIDKLHVSIEDTTIQDNTSESNYGGVYILYASQLTIEDTEIVNNTSVTGYGGICCDSGSATGNIAEVNVIDSKISGNSTERGNYGGGYFKYGTVTITDTEISDNTAGTSGGDYAYGGLILIYGNVTINGNTKISGNSAMQSSALRYTGTSESSLTIEGNVLISGNKSAQYGTVVITGGAGMTVNLTGGKIRENTGAGLYLMNLYGAEINLAGIEISDNTGTGLGTYIHNNYYSYRPDNHVNIKDGTLISGNAGGGVNVQWLTLIMSGGEISGNTATSGAGVYAANADFIVTGGTICDNTATSYGGGVYLTESATNYQTYDVNGGDKITGGIITGNIASNGGGVFVASYDTLTMSGGQITGNTATTYGGGVYLSTAKDSFTLEKDSSGVTGQIYQNDASLGQDVYAAYNSNYYSSGIYTYLNLATASSMFKDTEGVTGIGWLDEQRGTVTTAAISYEPVKKAYGLTLEYETDSVAAVVWNARGGADESGAFDQFTSVQAAVDAIQNADDGIYGSNEEAPEIILVADSVGNVRIPGGVTATLNLNGYTLRGTTTAISCYGNLTIQDVQYTDTTDNNAETYHAHYEQLAAIEGGTGKAGATGTISGTAATYGGGVYVYSGGYVTMTGGQIADCRAATGGAGVCVDSGTFVLSGTARIANCTATSNGGAVFVKSGASTFLLEEDAVIEGNTASTGGAVYVSGGSFRMTGGTLQNNTATTAGGALYIASGTGKLTGGLMMENTAANAGGGIYMAGGTVTLSNVKISDNTVTNSRTTDATRGAGGGVYVYSGTLNIQSGAEITGNTARRGGGIYQKNGTINMSGGRITANTADMGGGVAQYTASYSNPSNDRGTGVFTLSGGALCDNVSLTGAGNDVYSMYEGSGNYPGTNTSSICKVTLIPAAEMDSTDYNVWKDDNYSDSVREAENILEGQYVTGQIVQSYSLQLTAASYGDTKAEEETTTYEVQQFSLTEITDGTSPFNTDNLVYEDGTSDSWKADSVENSPADSWTAGNDSSATNGLVRTYDQITYNFSFVAVDGGQNNNTSGSGSGASAASNTAAEDQVLKVYVEASILLSSDQAEFTTGDMKSYQITETDNGQVLTGYYEVVITGDGTGDTSGYLGIRVKAMKNGETVKPTFKAWIGGNKDNQKNPSVLEPTAITVSATGKYNVTLLQNTQLAYTGYFNLTTGEEVSQKEYNDWLDNPTGETLVYGTMLGYGITLSMRNDGTGMKGTESPEGTIEFDLAMTGSLYLDGEAVTDINGDTIYSAPYVWAYKENEYGEYGNSLGGSSYTVNMDWNDEDDLARTTMYAYDAAPYNSRSSQNATISNSCYSGGAWTATGSQPSAGEEETTVHFSVSGYTVNSSYSDTNPSQASDGSSSAYFNSTKTKAFSAGYIQVIYPIDPEVTENLGGYLQIYMEGIVSSLEVYDSSGKAEGRDTSDETDEDLAWMVSWYGGEYQKYALGEETYLDNYVGDATGLYVGSGGIAETITKTNYFNTSSNATLSGQAGKGSTPLGSTVYIGADMNYYSDVYNTLDTTSVHYNAAYDEQIDNMIEYDYLTAVNLLQKFDADAYSPASTTLRVVDQTFSTASQTNSITENGTEIFRITTSETATGWSANRNKTMYYTLTVLYAAKPNGENWTYQADAQGYKTPTTDMGEYEEEDLIYFETLQDLYDYFGYKEDGTSKGVCVGILYEFRDCCIRTGRKISVTSRMNVTDDFEKTGLTWCTTNDVRGWTTYRPDYKAIVATGDGNLKGEIYDFSWREVVYSGTVPEGGSAGVSVYGSGNGELPAGYFDDPDNETYSIYTGANGQRAARIENYSDAYVQTQYSRGFAVPGTHTGWYSGNTLLLYTMVSDIAIQVTDYEKGSSNTPKTTYSLSQGERTASFMVTPQLNKASGVSNTLVDNGSQTAEMEIIITLPNHLNFDEGSLTFDYEGSTYQEGDLDWKITYVENTDGTSTITLTTTVTDVNDTTLPTIHYTCTIGKPGAGDNDPDEVTNGENLTTNAEIYITYEELNQISTYSKTSSVTIVAAKGSADNVWIEADGREELGEDIVFTMNYINRGADTALIELGNVLPYNGDSRDTSFHGGYQVTKIRLTFESEDNYKSFIDGLDSTVAGESTLLRYTTGVSYSADSTTLNAVFDRLKDDTTGKVLNNGTYDQKGPVTEDDGTTVYVVEYTLSDTEREVLRQLAGNTTGIALYVNLPKVSGGDTVQVDVTLSPDEGTTYVELIEDTTSGKVQQGGDYYYDSMFYKLGNMSAVWSNKTFIDVVERTVSGIAWMDQDHDGYYNSSNAELDKTLAGIDVYLYSTEEPEKTAAYQSELVAKNSQTGEWEQTLSDGSTTLSLASISVIWTVLRQRCIRPSMYWAIW
ncbi:MAG: hypothetical protein LUH58_03135 [Lachnospiraceae bacterium]|nr:hypothetical protein [Lachnospiraceae bacterium]